MNMHKLMLLTFATCLAGAAFAQDKQNATQEQPKQQKAPAAARLKMGPASPARTATGVKAGQQQGQEDRRERAEKVAADLQKKANDTAGAAASNVK